MLLQDIIKLKKVIKTDELAADTQLLKQTQTELAEIRLYPQTMIDGLWGPIVENALKEFCKSTWLNCWETGLWGPTWAEDLLEAKPPASKTLTIADYKEAAVRLGVEVATIKAVVAVEAAGAGFFNDGRPKILFEAHWFDKHTNGRYRLKHPNISSPYWNRKLYFGGSREYKRLALAQELNNWAALMSASWGLGQIMGFNHKLCGYSTVEAFVDAMHQSEGKQLLAMCEFIRSKGLVPALKRHNWAAFAYSYNGEGYRANAYDVKLAQAYRRFS